MKKNILPCILIILTGLNVYSQKPKADFSVNINYSCYDALLSYENKSVGAVQYFWKENDFSLRECYIPKERYYLEGKSFTTTLIAVSSDGQRDTITKNIEIDTFSKAILKYNKSDSSYYAPVTIQFFNESYLRPGADSLTYSWNIGSGINLKEKNPVYEFKTAGTYDINLKGKSNNCEINAYTTVIVKDTAQKDEFRFLKSGCNQDYFALPVPYDFGIKYEKLNDTLKIRGIYSGNCGTTKTATIRYKGDTIVIKSWEVGPLATCGCEYYFEINIPHYAKDSAIIFFNGERIKSIVSSVSTINKLDQSIRIFPNPVSDNLQLKLDDFSSLPLSIVFKDINGRKILEKNINTIGTNLNLSDLKAGIYFLYLYSNQGFTTRKIIKL